MSMMRGVLPPVLTETCYLQLRSKSQTVNAQCTVETTQRGFITRRLRFHFPRTCLTVRSHDFLRGLPRSEFFH